MAVHFELLVSNTMKNETGKKIQMFTGNKFSPMCSHMEKVRESMFEIHDQCSNQCSNTSKFF